MQRRCGGQFRRLGTVVVWQHDTFASCLLQVITAYYIAIALDEKRSTAREERQVSNVSCESSSPHRDDDMPLN
jgi:hypothetical protein